MAEVAEMYLPSLRSANLATTASPGSRKEQVHEICSRLEIQKFTSGPGRPDAG